MKREVQPDWEQRADEKLIIRLVMEHFFGNDPTGYDELMYQLTEYKNKYMTNENRNNTR